MGRPVKTILVAALVCLILAGVFVVLADGPKDTPTELYVRTDPPGAKIFMEGNELGTSPGLFEVKPGGHEIVVELAGHDPGRKQVVVPATEITRVILELKKRAKGPAGTSPDGPTRLTPIKRPSKAVSASEAAERILRTYAEAVWDELLPKTEKVDPQQAPAMVVRAAAEIAARHILPQKDLVARYLLEPLPQAPPIDRSQWTSALRQSQFEGVPPLGEQGFWSPPAVAQVYRSFVVGEKLGAEMLAKRSMLENYAPVPSALLDASLDQPEIATAYGDELMVVRLERDEAGLYHCREVEWLKRKPDGTQGYSLLPADATPAQRLIRQYSDAVWARLLPRLESLSFKQIMQETERIAEVHLVPEPDLLREESRRILAKLPKAGLPDRSRWRPRSPQLIAKAPSDAEAQAALEKLAEGLSQGESRPLYWDPVRLARGIRMSLFAELEGPEWFGRRVMIEAVALYPPDAAADADPEHPLIVTRTGNEMTVVALRRNEAGCYDVERFEWLVRVDGPAEGTLRGPPPGDAGTGASDPAGQPGPSEVDRAIEFLQRHHAPGVDRSELTAAAIQGMLERFDPDSAYVGLEEIGLANRELGQGLVGVGLELRFDDEARELLVITPLPDEACEVKLSPEELVQYTQYRHRRDVFREEGPPRSDFEDRQLEKALACLRTLLDTFQQP